MAESRSYLDFKAIKARVPIADVLARYRVKLSRVNQTALKGDCPLPSHSSGSKSTFYVNEAKSVWYCHSDSCKKNGRRAGGNAIDLVGLMESVSIYEAAKCLDEWFPASGNPATIPAIIEAAPESSNIPAKGNTPLAFALKDVNPEHPMIQERGISVDTAKCFGVGFFPGKGSMSGRIVFPLYERGQLVGYAGRTILPISDANPKWLFGKGLRKTFLYGLERCDPTKPLILCESLWGPLWFHENGLQAAALMGSEMTEEQEKCLDPFPTITVALDNDAAGNEKAARIRARLKMKHRVLKARLIE
jgi:DNA primase